MLGPPKNKEKGIMSSIENTYLKNVTPAAEDSNPIVEMGMVQGTTYQRSLLIGAGFLLTLLVWIAVSGSGGHQLTPSVYEIVEGADTLANYQVDTAQSVLIKDIFGVDAVSKNDEGKI